MLIPESSAATPLTDITGLPSWIIVSIESPDKEGATLSSERVTDIVPDFVSDPKLAVTSTK